MCVVPIKFKAKVVFAAPVTGYFLVSLEDRHEMAGVCFFNVFYAKIVNTEGGRNRAPLVRPETRSTFALVINIFVEALFE